MDHFIYNLKQQYFRGDIVVKLLFINIAVFLLLKLIHISCILFNFNDYSLLQYAELPSSSLELITHPWTLVTYMFVHYGILHLLFNMMWLYWFGRIFLQYFNERQFGGLYVLGGIVGGLFFVSAYNFFPYFRPLAGFSTLIGASAAVMAIVFAIAFYKKDYTVNIFLIGSVKLIYLALFSLFWDLLALNSTNAGGHIAHIGGALLGICYADMIRKGKDLTKWINRILDRMVNWYKKKPNRTPYQRNRAETDEAYHARKRRETMELDEILDKLKQSGYTSLSAEEKKKLFEASRK